MYQLISPSLYTITLFNPALLASLDSFSLEVWVVVLRAFTTPEPILVGRCLEVLACGTGEVGSVNIPDFIGQLMPDRDDDTITL